MPSTRYGTIDLNPAATNYSAFTGADQSIALPLQGGDYILSVRGASCVVRTGGAAAADSQGIYLPESSVIGPFRIDATAIRVFGSVGGGIWVTQVKA